MYNTANNIVESINSTYDAYFRLIFKLMLISSATGMKCKLGMVLMHAWGHTEPAKNNL